MLESIDDLRSRWREAAIQRGIDPRDVDLLLADLFGRSVGWLFAHGEEKVDGERLGMLLTRRFAGQPLQYIRGKTEFYGREFLVDDRVLIPRPETELVVEAALERTPRGGRVIDIGTGSGCIAISIEREREDLEVLAVDRSASALAVAALNRKRLGSNIRLAGSDVLSAVRCSADTIVSNPPYVPRSEYEDLAIEVRIHEPEIALTPGPEGTEIIDRIFVEAASLLAPNGTLILEVGYGQEARIRSLAAKRGYRIDAFQPDLAGIPRVVVSSPHGRQ